MKNIFTFSIVTLSAILFINPSTSEAYLSTAQTAARVTPEYSIFTITYDFQFQNRDTYLPVIAKRGIENGNTDMVLGYDIVTESGLRVQHGTTTAIVLGNVPFRNGQYYLPAKYPGKFTLLVVYEHEKNRGNIAAQVTSLPFIFKSKGNVLATTFLHEHELEGYKTPTLK